jgi:hypothetical protein
MSIRELAAVAESFDPVWLAAQLAPTPLTVVV